MKQGKKFVGIVALFILALIAIMIINKKEAQNIENSVGSLEELEKEEVVYAESYELTIKNISADKTLLPGLYVVHTEDFDMNYTGEDAPDEFYGAADGSSQDAFLKLIKKQDGHKETYKVEKAITPGEEFTISVKNKEKGGLYLSGFHGLENMEGSFSMLTPLELRGTSSQVTLTQYLLSEVDGASLVAVDVDNLAAIVALNLVSVEK